MGVSQQRKAVYLGTFDPLTLGHLDIITRASRMFDQLILGIGVNSSKSPCFELEERLDMVRGICAHLPNIHIDSFQGLAVNFAKNHDARIMVRGLRTEADYAYEMQMAMMNHILSSGIETIFIPTRQELSHISSSMVKEVAALGGNVSGLVPPLVFKKLSEKFSIA